MVALGMFLAFVFFGGGGAITYALMDAPRRKARQQLSRLSIEQAELDVERERQAAVAAWLDQRESTAAAQAVELEQRAKGLSYQAAAFEKRVISYDELGAEN